MQTRRTVSPVIQFRSFIQLFTFVILLARISIPVRNSLRERAFVNVRLQTAHFELEWKYNRVRFTRVWGMYTNIVYCTTSGCQIRRRGHDGTSANVKLHT